MMTSPLRLKCDTVLYRKGFIELSSNIHDGHINLETWGIDADCDLRNIDWVSDDGLSDSEVVNNTEIEISAEQARELGNALIAAANLLESEYE